MADSSTAPFTEIFSLSLSREQLHVVHASLAYAVARLTGQQSYILLCALSLSQALTQCPKEQLDALADQVQRLIQAAFPNASIIGFHSQEEES